MEKRTMKDLIEELCQAADRFRYLAIVVGFETHTRFVVYRGAEERQAMLDELNGLVKEGGVPVALFSLRNSDEIARGLGIFYSRPFPEFQGEDWVEGYLGELSQKVGEAFEASGTGQVLPENLQDPYKLAVELIQCLVDSGQVSAKAMALLKAGDFEGFIKVLQKEQEKKE